MSLQQPIHTTPSTGHRCFTPISGQWFNRNMWGICASPTPWYVHGIKQKQEGCLSCQMLFDCSMHTKKHRQPKVHAHQVVVSTIVSAATVAPKHPPTAGKQLKPQHRVGAALSMGSHWHRVRRPPLPGLHGCQQVGWNRLHRRRSS